MAEGVFEGGDKILGEGGFKPCYKKMRRVKALNVKEQAKIEEEREQLVKLCNSLLSQLYEVKG